MIFGVSDHLERLVSNTLKIIDNTAIIELDLEGKQLLGLAWNTKYTDCKKSLQIAPENGQWCGIRWTDERWKTDRSA